MERRVRLKESELRHIISESVKRVLFEGYGNAAENAIGSAFGAMSTTEDIEALGEEFGRKYQNNLLDALGEFFDGLDVVVKDDDAKRLVWAIRNKVRGY